MDVSGAEGAIAPVPVGRQCLFGVTILVVEDSRSASEAIRLLAAESGARVRRADSLGSAMRHLAIYRPNVVIVDLGLPDGDGLALVRDLAAAPTPIQAILATSGHDPAEWEGPARAAGATACLPKPVASLRDFQDRLLALLPDRTGRASERELSVASSAAVAAALEQDLRRARAILAEAIRLNDAESVAYAARFLASIGASREEAALGRLARSVVAALGAAGAAAGAPLLEALDARLDPEGVAGAA